MGNSATKAKNKYSAKAYDRINYAVPKGKKEEYKRYAEKEGLSLNAFITEAIEEKISKK